MSKQEQHKVRSATKDERTDCCGDRYPCNIEYVCSCGERRCIACMKGHLFRLHLVS